MLLQELQQITLEEEQFIQYFKIPVGKYLHYSSLSPNALTILRKQFQDVHTVVIDEISMVSQELLMFISRRLSEIKKKTMIVCLVDVI